MADPLGPPLWGAAPDPLDRYLSSGKSWNAKHPPADNYSVGDIVDCAELI